MAQPAPDQTNTVIPNKSSNTSESVKSNKLLWLIFSIFLVLALVGSGLYYFLYLNKNEPENIERKEQTVEVGNGLPSITIESEIPGVNVEIRDKSVFDKYFKEWQLDNPFGVDLRMSRDDTDQTKVKVRSIKVTLVDEVQPNGKIYDSNDGELIIVSSYFVIQESKSVQINIYFNNSFYSGNDTDEMNYSLSGVVLQNLYTIFHSMNLIPNENQRAEIETIWNDAEDGPLTIIQF